MRGQDLTQGRLMPQIWSLAWPVMLSIFFQTLYNAVDAFWVSKLAKEAIAAVSISQITLFVMVSLSMGITVGSGVLMAMNIGRRDIAEAERILGQSFLLSAIAGVIFTVICLAFRTQLLVASGATGSILPLAQQYFTWISGGSILVFLMFAVIFAFSSQGDNTTVTLLSCISTIINAALNPVLIFGWLGFPALGVRGSAIATLFAQLLVLAAGLVILARAKMMVALKWARLRIRWSSVAQVVNIGLPAALTNVIGPLSLSLLTVIISSRFSEAGAISFSIGFRVEFFAYLPAIGFGVAALAIMGQNTGAGSFDRVRTAYRASLAWGFLIATAFGLLVAAFHNQIIGVFTTDTRVREYARAYFLTIPFTYGLYAMMTVEISSLQGMGRSWPGFALTLVRVAIAIPAAFVLLHPLGMPLRAAWIALAVTNLGVAAAGYWWVRAEIERVASQPAAWAGPPAEAEPDAERGTPVPEAAVSGE
ncbi:MAG TPA: MATE family efflux transporter [Spirochaetia bacterium]|nr:MATE family efflux transporter [Spirochaetia bacterium]